MSPVIFIFIGLCIFAGIALLAILATAIVVMKLSKTRFSWSLAIFTLVVAALMTGVALIAYNHVNHKRDIEASALSNRTLYTQPAATYSEPPVWLDGIEDQFQADIYPSKTAACRALGLRMIQPIHLLFGPENTPEKNIVFKANHSPDFLAEFTDALSRSLPGLKLATERESVAIGENQLGIRIDLVQSADEPDKSQTLRAVLLTTDDETSAEVRFTNKPWLTGPDHQFILAKSQTSCTAKAEANHQAIENACEQLTAALTATMTDREPRVFVHRVTPADLIEHGIIADRFTQSFEGKAARIWRQALLVDASPEKLEQLAAAKTVAVQAAKLTWTRLFVTITALLTLIIGVFAFLNAATKGYYIWSLRIAATVIALFAVASAVLLLGH